MVHIINFLILAALFWGRSFRHKNPAKHIIIMAMVVAADVTLVLYLALARQVLSGLEGKMSPLLAVHIAMALLTIVFYVLAAYEGIQLKKGIGVRKRKRWIDRVIVPMRVGVFATSLFLVVP